MAEWERAGREPDYLLTGARQAEYERWSTTATLRLTSAETEFLDAARDHEVAERRREASRSAHEAQLGRRARRRLWGLVAALAALAVVALVVFVVTRPESRPRVAVPFLNVGDRSVNDLVASGFARAEQSLDFEAAEATLGLFSDVGEYLTDHIDQGQTSSS